MRLCPRCLIQNCAGAVLGARPGQPHPQPRQQPRLGDCAARPRGGDAVSRGGKWRGEGEVAALFLRYRSRVPTSPGGPTHLSPCPVCPRRSYTNPRASLQDDSAPTSPREVRRASMAPLAALRTTFCPKHPPTGSHHARSLLARAGPRGTAPHPRRAGGREPLPPAAEAGQGGGGARRAAVHQCALGVGGGLYRVLVKGWCCALCYAGFWAGLRWGWAEDCTVGGCE